MALGFIRYNYKRLIAKQYPIYINKVIYYKTRSPYLGIIFYYI